MSYAFDEGFRTLVAARCAAFPRQGVGSAVAGLKRAAVAITLLQADDVGPDGDAAFILTRRIDGLRAHGGQWALPGGRCDAGETPVQAALRELVEEIDLRLEAGAVLGLLDDYPTRSGYLITPIVLWAGAGAHLRLNADEVASVHRIPVADIMRPDAVSLTTIPESDRRVVRVRINGNMVHAPTAAMIYQFREVLAGRATRVADLEQPVFAWR
jgi:8-oxo-dGTP pyrophosphatase MutT (NUDIX family)